MREYKFRGEVNNPKGLYQIPHGTWVHGENYKRVKNQFGEGYLIFINGYEVDPDTVGQIFPFKDMEENELYPGDIVKTIHTRASERASNDDPFSNTAPGYEEYEKIGFLEYYQGYSFGPRLRWKKGHMMIPNTSTLWRMKAIKLGNRFDNPELLGEVRE